MSNREDEAELEIPCPECKCAYSEASKRATENLKQMPPIAFCFTLLLLSFPLAYPIALLSQRATLIYTIVSVLDTLLVAAIFFNLQRVDWDISIRFLRDLLSHVALVHKDTKRVSSLTDSLQDIYRDAHAKMTDMNERVGVAIEKHRSEIEMFAWKVQQAAGTARIPMNIKSEQHRFVVPTDGSFIVDGKTNLMWAQSDNGSEVNWSEAESYCKECSLGGYTDWRTPSIEEIESLHYPLAKGQYKIFPLFRVDGMAHSSTRINTKKGEEAYYFNFKGGTRDTKLLSETKRGFLDRLSGSFRVLCVRAGRINVD